MAVIELRANDSTNGNVGEAYVELVQHGVPVYWHTLPSEFAGELACNIAGPVRNCVVVDGVGAHAGVAYPIVYDGTKLHIGSPVSSDTPILDAADLDGDNRIDVRALQNDYTPDYATGQVQWQTFQRSNDGLSFRSTGCGPFSHSRPAEPTALQTGPCAG